MRAVYCILSPATGIAQACKSTYADDSTIYASVTTANEVTETLNKNVQSVLEWVHPEHV